MERLQFLNLGCGTNPVASTDEVEMTNVDIAYDDPRVVKFDLTQIPYPLPDGFFDRVYLFHTIEHIPEEHQGPVLLEMRRVLKDSGTIVITYPEFSEIARNWLLNKNGDRAFWKATIYGRGLTEWDRHKALMDTGEFSLRVGQYGLQVAGCVPEKSQDFNTVCILVKCEPTLTYEKLMGMEFVKP